jgi:hypothetical protein
VDEVQRAEALHKASHHALAGGDEETHPDMNPSKRNCGAPWWVPTFIVVNR